MNNYTERNNFNGNMLLHIIKIILIVNGREIIDNTSFQYLYRIITYL